MFALLVLAAADFLVVLDGLIVSVALPSIQRDLGFSQAGLQWVVNGYLLAFGGLGAVAAGAFLSQSQGQASPQDEARTPGLDPT
jgi:MFS family permease